MPDTRAVELVLELPADVAESVEEVTLRDPEYLRRLLKVGLARRAVFHELRRSLAVPPSPDPHPTERMA
ncbi:MAG: hypothetical protein M8860_05840 [marine benthic group bacterium]|jgi:hypothetical protein|nr:hypothetical protein [Gemmatimonadota bacterium]MCL7962356.1 hypothetical protein [Candidatus Carthagonibacter metallireducens]MCL7977492.1 hypothetical protein [Gemmatimonadota bacterium]MCL7979765.1 hypothetical protein [Gemmatimonadota bacterium]MCL7990926.1 hypothetical protein [Gemmatimonadota bacterium]